MNICRAGGYYVHGGVRLWFEVGEKYAILSCCTDACDSSYCRQRFDFCKHKAVHGRRASQIRRFLGSADEVVAALHESSLLDRITCLPGTGHRYFVIPNGESTAFSGRVID